MIKIFEDIKNIPAEAKDCVVVIGNFDAVHIGHQHLISEGKRQAELLGAKLAVMTFDPHPVEFFAKKFSDFRVLTNKAKYKRFENLGVDFVYNVKFDDHFKSLSAIDFVDNILVNGLKIKHLFVGDDFAFGRGKTGNIEILHKLSAANDFGFTPINKVFMGDIEASSTAIRGFIKSGDFNKAAEFLGAIWHIDTEIIEGDKRGRELGFPTANQKIGKYIRPAYGVYATKVQIEGEAILRDAVTNFGIRPMFAVEEPLIETHIFDFNEDIYGKNMKVHFIEHIRGEAKFSSLDELTDAIKNDCKKSKTILSSLDNEKFY